MSQEETKVQKTQQVEIGSLLNRGKSSNEILVIDSVSKSFSTVMALDNVSFTVPRGSLFSIIGPSGCGKTTLLRSIAGLEEIDDGEIRIDGEVVSSGSKKTSVPPEQRQLGLVFQSYALWPHMTVYDNIESGLKARKFKDTEKYVARVLELVGLQGLEKRYPSQLSGGQQQRVALARSLAYEPKMILLDEPLSNLDAKVRARVRTELKTLLEKIGITAVYVTHDQEEAFVVSDHIAVMNHGKLIQLGSPNEIYSRPRNSFVADFIGRANLFDAKIKEVTKRGLVIEILGLGSFVSTESNPESAKLETSLMVSVRPEAIRLHKSIPENQTNVTAGLVVLEENRGATIDHQVVIGDQRLTSMTLNSVQFEKGDKVYVEIPPEAIKIIPK